MNVLPENLDSVLFVSTSGNETLLGEVIYKSCNVEIAGRKLSINLIVIDMRDFDIILRMN